MYLLYLIILVLFSCSSNGRTEESVVARVNNKALTKEALAALVGSGANDTKTLLRATSSWVEKTLLYNAAVAVGLKKDAEIIKQRDQFYKDLLVSSFLDIQTRNKIKITKKDVSNYYADNKKSFARPHEEVFIKHFILPNRKVANK
ncbi:uncharacterized protein METZ01_LOCUS408823, partial [marine metagenome]